MNLNAELARALGLPRYCRKAVLTIEANKAPRIEVDCLATDSGGRLIVEHDPEAIGSVARKLASVQFVIRLERAS